MEVRKHLEKFELLLKNVFERKIVLDKTRKENLLMLLEDRNENSPGKLLLGTPRFPDLICQALEKRNEAPSEVQVFLIEAVIILFKNEIQFTKMQRQAFQKIFYEICISFSAANNDPMPDLQFLTCIQLATTQIAHDSGIKIIKECKLWRYILHEKIHHRPKQAADAAYNFMAKLVWKLNEYDKEQELLEVLGYIVETILSSGYLNLPCLDIEMDTELSDKIFPNFSALLAVYTEAENYEPDNKVVTLLKDHFIIDQAMYEIFGGSKNLNLLKLLNSCLFRYCLETLRPHLSSNKIDDFCNKMSVFHRNYMVHTVKKREVNILVDFVIQSNTIWSHFEKSHATEFNFPFTFEINGHNYDFSLQIFLHMLMPILKYTAIYRISRQQFITDLIDKFLGKLGRTVTDYIMSSCYLFGNCLEDCPENFRMQVATHTLKQLLRLKKHITKTQVGPTFQSLYYLLEIFIIRNEAGKVIEPENMDESSLRLLSHLLEAMKMLLKEHNIPWLENPEIVNIQADFLNLLTQSFLTTKQVVQVLDLINICILKFLSPNMSLLVESKCGQDITLSEISKVIKLYSQHEDWEVRDSALSILKSCTEISFIKYVPLQKMIRDNNLIILAAKSALTDIDFYAQCTALKCLTAATKIAAIWHEVLIDNPDIHLQLINLIKNNDEGMVRKEALNVLTGVYANQKVTLSFCNSLYEVMSTVAIDDLHWEVQLAALTFWKTAIHKCLTDIGMCNGNFPTVIFSKEKRKIITLNRVEIHRQLNSIMNHLSSIGCLTVLIECMNEINNIEVMEQAYCVVKDLIEILEKYEFQYVTDNVKAEANEIAEICMDQDMIMPTMLHETTEDERNEVINSILNIYQSELIMNLYDNNNCEINSDEMNVDLENCPRRKLVKANEFIDIFRDTNYSLIIEDKKKCAKCVSTLDELLDEMLSL